MKSSQVVKSVASGSQDKSAYSPEVSESLIVSRNYIHIEPSPIRAINPGNEVRFEIPSDMDFLLSSMYLALHNVTCSATGGADPILPENIASLISDVRVEVAGQEVWRMPYFNWTSLLKYYTQMTS